MEHHYCYHHRHHDNHIMVPEEIAIMIIMITMVPEERGPEDAEGEEEAEREAEEERGEDRERDQHRVPGHQHLYKLKRELSISLCQLKTERG